MEDLKEHGQKNKEDTGMNLSRQPLLPFIIIVIHTKLIIND